ncbi:MAG TPA: hypothetical protein VK158_02375 [Acidobacteriota bacterium]|nr:hypothetical protein [Acidobacteriota bacterium]
MMNKRGIELSVNFLVIFILAMVTFSMGIFIVQKIMTSSQKYVDDSQEELDARIKSLSCSSERTICIAGNNAVIESGDTKLYSIILYHRDDAAATVSVDIVPFKAYDSTGTGYISSFTPTGTNKVRALMVDNTVELDPNQRTSKAIMVASDKDAPAGQYIFTIEVSDVSGDWQDIADTLIINVR